MKAEFIENQQSVDAAIQSLRESVNKAGGNFPNLNMTLSDFIQTAAPNGVRFVCEKKPVVYNFFTVLCIPNNSIDTHRYKEYVTTLSAVELMINLKKEKKSKYFLTNAIEISKEDYDEYHQNRKSDY